MRTSLIKYFNPFVHLTIAVGILSFASCSATKNVKYFENLSDSIRYQSMMRTEFVEPVIQPDDLLWVNIQTLDSQSSLVTNQVTTLGTNINSTSPGSNGFLVDKEGKIELPLVGVIMVGGMTTSKAKEVIRLQAQQFYKNPIIQVRFSNFKVTVIGEVARPSTYIMPNERVTILDALGVAGDLTIYGKRENILLTRSLQNGKQEFVRLNLNSSEIFSSPYFYLKQNDVIYIEPNKAKLASTDASKNRTIALTGTALSLLIVIASRLL